MLRSLHIENYVLIDSLDITFPEGLIIITGQTGAGKSILLGALGLLRGAKADAEVISGGADTCVVEAEFDVKDPDGKIRELLDEAGCEWEDGCLIIRRVVYSTGRSRAFVNDSPVTVQTLSQLSDHIVDIHSQHQSLLLQDKLWQMSVLDHFAGADSLKENLGVCWRKLKDAENRLSTLDEQISRLSSEQDYNQAQWEQLDKAALRSGEIASLEEEQKQLANAESISGDLGAAIECFNPSSAELTGIPAALREAEKYLGRVARFIPAAQDLAQRISSCRIEVEDIDSEMETIAGGISSNPDRLMAVEDRLSLLYSLLKKHGCSNEDELIAKREELSSLLFDSTALQEKRNRLEKEISALESEYDALADSLSAARQSAAPAFAREIEDSIHFLELDRAVFQVKIEAAKPSQYGKDAPQFLFAANGNNPSDLSRCASGGEMSRIMLCLKAMMARFVGMPTMIFDEIDTGVSGSAADKMGSMICAMGADMQLISITHLPQVAAKGNAHYVVSKSVTPDGSVKSSIKRLDREERIMEIARLLSGESITAQAIANAESLL